MKAVQKKQCLLTSHNNVLPHPAVSAALVRSVALDTTAVNVLKICWLLTWYNATRSLLLYKDFSLCNQVFTKRMKKQVLSILPNIPTPWCFPFARLGPAANKLNYCYFKICHNSPW